MRVLLDTNVWVSGILFQGVERRLLQWLARTPDGLLQSEVVQDELQSVLLRLGAKDLDDVQKGLLEAAMRPFGGPTNARRGGDEAVLADAARLGADLVVTGDRRLLHQKQFRGVSMFRPRDALRILGSLD